jgi:polyhydroxyalkanoate synthesis regulator phasin
MGLLTGILTLPLAPLRGTVAIAEQIRQQAEEAYYDPAAIRRELEQVDQLRTDGEITEDEATAWEDQLIERMMIARGGSGHG